VKSWCILRVYILI